MASSLVTRSSRRPVVCAFLYPRSCISSSALIQTVENVRIINGRIISSSNINNDFKHTRNPTRISRRFLSSSASRKGRIDGSRAARDHAKHNQRGLSRDRSMTVEMKRVAQQMVDQAGATLDCGLLPATLVMPTSSGSSSSAARGKHLPSVMSRDRWRLEWARAVLRAKELASLLVYKYRSGARGKARPKLDSAGLPDIARRLHHDMWTAYAAGDIKAIRALCAQGLAETLTGRISRRGSAERTDWTLHHYVGRPSLISNKAAEMMDGTGMALRQAVIRIRSRQSLTTMTNAGKKGAKQQQQQQQQTAADTAQGKECDELIVIQRLLINKKESEWVVWGTTKESDITPILDGRGVEAL